ncbi:MAG TPA: CHAT domain-containing protein [Micromonosporaceae bacterium]|nr:CHAT domain-containing protein [Micromonosporaceae bacterium]
MAPRYQDLQELLLRHQPAMVHYAGHSGVDGIVVEGEDGYAHAIPPAALEELFAIVRGSVRCVVLNACLTMGQALAIGSHVPCVVGMSRLVPDHVAIIFAAGFYRAVAEGKSVTAAFRLGRNRLALCGLDVRGPVLIDQFGEAENVFITG